MVGLRKQGYNCLCVAVTICATQFDPNFNYRASYASAVLAVIGCLSVRLSQVGVVQRWLNLGSH